MEVEEKARALLMSMTMLEAMAQDMLDSIETERAALREAFGAVDEV